jgi:hypothetical protein
MSHRQNADVAILGQSGIAEPMLHFPWELKPENEK